MMANPAMGLLVPIQIGKYPVIRELGRGMTGRVYLARDPFGGREVAIKLVSTEDIGNPEDRKVFRKAFLNEASLAGKLSHPHIVGILDAVVEEAMSYIVMEYIDGSTLDQYCSVDNLLPLEKVVEITFKSSRALEFANHAGVIHRDIKPANILMQSNGDIKISDFGAALLHDAEETQLTGVGSPAYMSPEQLREQPLTLQTDIYSLGVVMYRLLTGKFPFNAASKASLIYQILNIDVLPPSVHRSNLPAQLDSIVLCALQKDLSLRYRNWNEFGRDLTGAFKNLVMPGENIPETEKFDTIKSLPFFRDFHDVQIWEALRITAWKKLPKGTVIIREGDQGDCFYVLAEGEVTVSKQGKPLNALKRGDCFGEMLYFRATTAQRKTSVIASTPVTVVEIKASSLTQASNPCQNQFNKAFLSILIERHG
ncbi:MAG TPA: protein kinase [Burkholderiales bacterium]|nr:protein kinase [Burkholderiales bacterium]